MNKKETFLAMMRSIRLFSRITSTMYNINDCRNTTSLTLFKNVFLFERCLRENRFGVRLSK